MRLNMMVYCMETNKFKGRQKRRLSIKVNDSTIRGYVDITADGAYDLPLPAYATLHGLHDARMY